jgi:hypothetical protein
MSTKKLLKQSETIEINRSQINFAPYNPKHHTEDAIKQQKKNFKEVGFLGGIVWNKLTGNLVSGHKRIMAIDLEYKYDGTPETDYKVKVEAIELTDKQEKEQNIFMDARGTNTPQDLKLIAELIPDIDTSLAGLTDQDLNLITMEVPNITFGNSDIIKEAIKETKQSYEDNKQAVKNAKQAIKDKVKEKSGDAYIILSFNDINNKSEFMERFGYKPDDNIIKGEIFSDQIERIS